MSKPLPPVSDSPRVLASEHGQKNKGGRGKGANKVKKDSPSSKPEILPGCSPRITGYRLQRRKNTHTATMRSMLRACRNKAEGRRQGELPLKQQGPAPQSGRSGKKILRMRQRNRHRILHATYIKTTKTVAALVTPNAMLALDGNAFAGRCRTRVRS